MIAMVHEYRQGLLAGRGFLTYTRVGAPAFFVPSPKICRPADVLYAPDALQ
jgi:hypothetical protein